MITNIGLQNFKCFRDLDISPKLVTVLIGPNGTGKSGVLQALLLLKQSRDNLASLTLDGDFVRFRPETLMFLGVTPELNGVQMSVSGCCSLNFGGVKAPVGFEAHVSYSGATELSDYSGAIRFHLDGEQCEIILDGQIRQLSTHRGTITYDTSGGTSSLEIQSYSGDQGAFSVFLEEVSQALADTLEDMTMVPAARAFARQLYPLGPESAEEISGVGGLGKQEEDTATTLAYSRPVVDKVSQLMKKVTGVGFRTDTVPPQSVMPVSESPAGDVGILAEGFGANTLVQLLFEVVRAVPGATVLIEEPEVHLHPKAQADLASVLVDEAKADGKQIIMTTHSEHIAGRLLTLVAEGKLSADELAIYSFEKDESGVCSASEIEVTERGQVTGGLKSFFQTDLDEMRRYVDALRNRA